MFDNKTVNDIFLGKPDGRRTAERPKSRFLDNTENHLK
jgi:hypothetical protein